MREGNLSFLKKELHTIKGVASNIDAEQLRRAVALMEKNSSERIPDRVEKDILDLDDEFERIRDFFTNLPPPGQGPEDRTGRSGAGPLSG